MGRPDNIWLCLKCEWVKGNETLKDPLNLSMKTSFSESYGSSRAEPTASAKKHPSSGLC